MTTNNINMAEEFIMIDELKNLINIPDDIDGDNDLIINPNSIQNLYQIRGNTDKSSAIIKYIGKNHERPAIKVLEFKFKKYFCEIMSYLLSDVDINLAEDKCCFKMLGLLIRNKKKHVVCAVTMSFYTFIHKKDKKSIMNYITQKDEIDKIDKDIPGFFGFEMKWLNSDKILKEERIGNLLEKFPGKNKSIYTLVNFLSDTKLSFLF